MPRSEYQRASFMKLCLGDFSSKLCIPTKFMMKYRQAVQHSVVLETEYSPTLWDVKIKHLNSDFYMTDGWSEFVTDNQVGERDFLTFRFVAESTFKVSVYRSNGCATSPISSDVDESGVKRRSVRPLKKKREKGAKASRMNCVVKEGNPLCFEACLNPHRRYRINLPKEFTDASNMKVKNQVRVEFVGNGGGRGVFHVTVDARPPPHSRVDLATGWSQFRVANGLVVGESYSFEFNPDDQVIYVKEASPFP
ncbi:putative B3 domain-containing protein Os03g0621600 [Salvia miltiorrhiza]|uniref:putative B3 domain-containing protein Os03g0621600 n=1 Tax=Salvia miltiorrhiza TaxID=226208 RepID=UPI0025AC7461|nr:putative B3 domain-containing protein Os03g0621600 [Salvia miltiorrhiza]